MADEKPKGAGAMQVDTELVRTLAEMLTANDLNEIEVEDGERKIKVVRHREFPSQGGGFIGHELAAPAPMAVGVEPLPAPVAAAPSLGLIKSPIVGTVFLSAEPGAAPFIAIGAAIRAGDTLMIIEAMKVMNPILAAKAGTVRQLLVADAQPVEFDQPLAVID